MENFAQLQTEIKDGFTQFKTELNDFRKENDNRLKALEKGRGEDPLQKEKMERLEKSLSDLEAKQAEIKTVIARAGEGGNREDAEKKTEQRRKEVFAKFLRKGERSLTPEEHKIYTEGYAPELKATFLSRGSEVDGGYFVTPEMGSNMEKKVFETSPMRQLCSQISIGTDAYEEPADWDEATIAKSNEVGSRSQTNTPQFKHLRIVAHEMYALGYATQQILEDSSINMESFLTEKFVDKFSRTENDDFLNGDGVNEAKGLLSYASADAYGSIERVTSTVSASLAGDDLISVQDSLFEPFQANASWLMRRATASAIRKLKDGMGQYLLDMKGDMANGYQAMLLGAPVYKGADMPALGASADAIAYGDFKKCYLIVDRIGVAILRDPFSAKPYVQFYARKRVGGGVRNYQAVKVLRCLA